MEDIIYKLVLKNAAGLTLLGTLRYRVTDIEVLAPAVEEDGADAKLFPTINVAIYLAEGTITIPLLTGLRALPVRGQSLITLVGAPVTTFMSRNAPEFDIAVQFNLVDDISIGGGFTRTVGALGTQVYSLLGTRSLIG
ncbi:MAG: hypothetical protein ABW202_12130 [Duganella sp.]